ncbi:MAG: NTP transferase domain-containing protein, partial [Pseudomonadota bacterium]|nr:NTP transferase domain-containing protein [Pseudomonadota bacterium]
LPSKAEGVLVCLADMPGLATEVIDAVLEVFSARQGLDIVHVRRPDGGPGHPVAWPREFFPELLAMTGDQGGRGLICKVPERVTTVPGTSSEILVDIDTAKDLDLWNRDR